MAQTIQIVRAGAASWIVWKVGPAFKVGTGGDTGREYEEVARIAEVNGLFYVELPQWSGEGAKWERQGRGWLTKEGAVRSVTQPKQGARA